MDTSFCTILQSVLKYDRGQRFVVIALLTTVLLIFGILFFKMGKTARRSDRVIIGVLIVTYVVAGLAYLIHDSGYRKLLLSDIQQESFVTFYGHFQHDDYQKDSFYHNVYLTDANGEVTILRLADYSNMYNTYVNYKVLPIGSFYGTITYSAKSKIVVDWNVEESSDDTK